MRGFIKEVEIRVAVYEDKLGKRNTIEICFSISLFFFIKI
jgi:hypothetical protein